MQPIRYDIRDNKTGRIVGTAKTRAGATASVNRRDNAYGGYRFVAVPVYADADDNLTYVTGVSC